MLIWNVSGDQIIPGFHEELVATNPEVPTSSKYLWGLRGNVLVIGRQAKRAVSVKIWLSDPSWLTDKDFYTGVTTYLENNVGSYGTLRTAADGVHGVWEPGVLQTFQYMLFAGYENLPFAGQEVWGPVKDEAACLYAKSIVALERDNQTYAAAFRLNFIQTVPDRVLQ